VELSVIISYIPGMRANKHFIDNKEDLASLSSTVDAENMGEAKGCAWTVTGNRAEANLIMKDAALVAEHMAEWTEGEPEKWFHLMHTKKNGMYSFALFPDVKKSIERTKINYQLQNGGWPIQTAEKMSIFFRPIMFVSKSTVGYDQALMWFGKKMKIYVLDVRDVPLNTQPTEEAMNKRILLGEFKIWQESPMGNYLEEFMKEE